MKRKSCSPCDSLESFFDDNELEVSEILIQIPLIIFQAENRNRLLVPWGVRKRRSAIDPDLYPPSVPSSSSPHLPGTCVGPTCDDDDPQAKVEPSSPATPLSFSPSETDGKSKRSKKSVSSKKVSFTNLRFPISHSFCCVFFLGSFLFLFSHFCFQFLIFEILCYPCPVPVFDRYYYSYFKFWKKKSDIFAATFLVVQKKENLLKMVEDLTHQKESLMTVSLLI